MTSITSPRDQPHSITRFANGQQVRGDVQSHRPRGLEIDDEFELGRRLRRQVGRCLSLENAVVIGGGAPEHVRGVGPVGNQRALLGELPIDRR